MISSKISSKIIEKFLTECKKSSTICRKIKGKYKGRVGKIYWHLRFMNTSVETHRILVFTPPVPVDAVPA